ncbi:EAL domain-containing protein [Petrocella sp. FN5]|uniref:EAL domain-containing protein n=1 Tax=Petrocella sp. FN5 TaxID=3032002 RepID=UPI0023DA6EAA|nr:EAL domain-containing protein [Petrocella sp. FN5]MDF1617156.1 EAL domain-containing protein [Petrocella sp. FN5]
MKATPNKFKYSLNKKLMMVFVVLLSLATFGIGVSGYYIASKALQDKGEVTMKNAVVMALKLIEAEYDKSLAGATTEEEAKENVKVALLGPMNEDGTRTLHGRIDLGENGYMIIYDLEGTEIMHPTLEGLNVIDVTDMKNPNNYIVRDQIEKGLNGGGFTYYSWVLPHSDVIADKIAYAGYDPNWGWIVSATAYEMDFNASARIILFVLVFIYLGLMILITVIAAGILRRVTRPVILVSEGMGGVSKGVYQTIPEVNSQDEIGQLTKGYNLMVASMEVTRKNLTLQTERLTYLAYNDELTKLPNRNRFKKHVITRMKQCNKEAYLVQLDIRAFKVINSTMGYDQGDELLKKIGTYFRSLVKDIFFIARTSGNEFSIWLEEKSAVQVRASIEKLQEGIHKFLITNEFLHPLDYHVAIANYPDQGLDFEMLYNKVSMAMKHAKEQRNTKIYLFDSDMEKAIIDELEMRKYLKVAIEEKKIAIHYQEKYDFVKNKVVGVEALSRWFSDELGYVPPNVFIPALSELNLTSKFGDYIIDKVMGDYAKLKEIYGDGVTVSINISPTHFLEVGFLTTIMHALVYHNVPAEKVILEVTEDIFIADFKKIATIITSLHVLGLKVSIDDFGTGYSSFNYLKSIDFDEMKIDKTFMDQIIEDDKAFKLFQILCDIAKIYDYDIVAEGVETMEQLEMIQGTSLSIVQGYLFSKPQPIEKLKGQREPKKIETSEEK